MTTELPKDVDTVGNPSVTQAVRRTARAYCGPAHGQHWIIDSDIEFPAVVWLEGLTEAAAYRLARNPATRRPARDRLGNVVYMPKR
jgi:hypothetical protein